jgi:hypothetical protein
MVPGGATRNGPRHVSWNFVASCRAWIKGDFEHGRFRLPPGDDSEFVPFPGKSR